MAEPLINPELIASLAACVPATPRAVARELSGFLKLVEIGDLEMAMVRVRRALESMIRSACSSSGIEPGDRPLDHLIATLVKAGALPEVVRRHCRVVQEFGNLSAHVAESESAFGELPGSSLSALEADYCARSLSLIAGWYQAHVLPRVLERPSFRVLTAGEIGLPQLTEAAGIDVHVYPPEFRGKPDVLLGWHRRNRDVFTLVADVDTGRVVGCLTVLPLTDDIFARIESGALIDVELPVSAIRTYDLPDFYKLYVASVVVDPTYQGSAAFRALYEAYLAKLLDLAQRDIFVTEVLADVVSADGERLAAFIGMEKVRPSQHNSTIQKAMLLPPSLRVTTRRGKQLCVYYEAKYEEFKDLLRIGSPPDATAADGG